MFAGMCGEEDTASSVPQSCLRGLGNKIKSGDSCVTVTNSAQLSSACRHSHMFYIQILPILMALLLEFV
jgi:hypothetical protein